MIVLLASSAGAARVPPCDFGDPKACPVACAAGHLESCYFHGRALSSGIHVERDPTRASALFKEACERGHPDSCNAFAHTILDTAPDENNDVARKAVPFFEKACGLGSAKGCSNAGSFLRRESLGRTAESQGFFERGCTLDAVGADTACMTAAVSLRDGKWDVAVDRAEAARLFARACTLGSQSSCANATELGLPSSISPVGRAARDLTHPPLEI